MLKHKILHLLSWQPNAENPMLGNFCFQQIKSVAESTESVVILLNRSESNEIKFENKDGYRILNIGMRKTFRCFRKLRLLNLYNIALKKLRKKGFIPDLVHVHVAYPTGWIALFWKKIYGLKYIVSEHSSIYYPERLKTKLLLWNSKLICNSAEMLLPVSRNLSENMRRVGITGPFKVVFNAVDKVFIDRIPENKPHEGFNFIHVSSLEPESKNFDGILNVLKRLKNEGLKFKLNVVHDFSIAKYEQKVKDFVLEENVCFLGHKSPKDLAELYAHSDVLLMFSNFETFSCTVMEAISVGIPVIATKVGEIPEMLSEGRGLLLNPGDEEMLYEKIAEFVKNPIVIDVVKQKKYAEKMFSKESIRTRLVEIYDKNIREGRLNLE